HDGIAEGGFAWIGVGEINAGPQLTVDFRQGLPDDWSVPPQSTEHRTELVEGGVPFLRWPAVYTMIPSTGVAEISCGFAAERLFFLGCTVAGGKPLETYGSVEIVYGDGPSERSPANTYRVRQSTRSSMPCSAWTAAISALKRLASWG
ncbi:MAG: hypothetical protein ABIK89_13935, partial [Planctomycetota bacterium]